MASLVQQIANRCRWETLGYRNDPGTEEDIVVRLNSYEECVRLWMRSEQHLKERIAELEKELRARDD